MTFKEYISSLIKIAKEDESSLNLEVVYSSDDEGNYFSPVLFAPTKGELNDGKFDDAGIINAICIN